MSDFPGTGFSLPGGFISPLSSTSPLSGVVDLHGLTPTSAVWPTANLALFLPFTVETWVTVYQILWINGATASGNLDVGVYDITGAKLVSKGSTAQSGTSTVQAADVTDTALSPGYYYVAMAMNGTTGTTQKVALDKLSCQTVGMQQMATAFALPTTATFANPGQNYVPILGVALRATA